MRRTIHLITGLSTGGAERALFNLLDGGLARRFSSHVISLSDEGTLGPKIRNLGVPVSILKMPRGRPSLSSLTELRRVIRDFQPDLIQGWMYHGNLAATLSRALAQGRPSLAWNVRHSLSELGHEKLMTRQVIRTNRYFSWSPDALLYNSLRSRRQHEDFGFTRKNGQTISNGIDVHRFRFCGEARNRIRSELGIPAGAVVAGHIARLHPMKDHAMFLQAATVLACRHPSMHFLLAGKDVVSNMTDVKQIVAANLIDRFHLLGERSDIPDLLSAIDVFCLSSAWGEGFPNVIGEAMAVGVPCIATDVGDSGIIIGNTGIVVPPGDRKALENGIETLLTMPLVKRCTLGAKARARIASNYTLGVIVDEYAALYEKLLTAKATF